MGIVPQRMALQRKICFTKVKALTYYYDRIKLRYIGNWRWFKINITRIIVPAPDVFYLPTLVLEVVSTMFRAHFL